MTALEALKVFSELGAIGVLGAVVYLFVNGKIMSETSVKKITDAQGEHMDDLKTEITTLKQHWGKKLDKMIGILDEIRKNGAMNRKK